MAVREYMDASLCDDLDRLFASDPDAMRRAFEIWARLAELGPATPYGTNFAYGNVRSETLLLTRYQDCKFAIRDTKVIDPPIDDLDVDAAAARPNFSSDEQAAYADVANFERHYMNRSGASEKHARLRRIAHRAFTPRAIAALDESARRYTHELVEETREANGDGTGDLAEFGYRLPLMLICDMLGVPPDDRDLVHGWSARLGRNRGGTEVGPLLDAREAMREFRAYVDEILADHRRDPSSVSPLVATLMDANEEERLDGVELTAMFVILLFAGHETTTNLLSIGMLELLRRPEQWRLLCDDPAGLSAGATEELLRFVTPVQWLTRTVGRPTTLAGVELQPGDQLMPILALANRDPDVFVDPDVLDVVRANSREHLSLGFGIHHCLGQALARLEGQAGFETLALRFPDLELADEPGSLPWRGHSMLRNLGSVPVAFGRDRGRDVA